MQGVRRLGPRSKGEDVVEINIPRESRKVMVINVSGRALPVRANGINGVIQ
jgi:hypothetical protein